MSEHNSYCSRSTRITRLHVSRINGVRQQSAGNTTDDAEWMRNDAALFPDELTKGQLLNRFCDHHELLDYTSRFVRG